MHLCRATPTLATPQKLELGNRPEETGLKVLARCLNRGQQGIQPWYRHEMQDSATISMRRNFIMANTLFAFVTLAFLTWIMAGMLFGYSVASFM